jgi:DNA-binding CsgD family transcriptional regulator
MNTSRQPEQFGCIATSSLFESSDVVESLRRIVKRLHAITGDHEDLMQEARIHLWLVETKRPNQTLSWYLQNCGFFLHNLLACGRSLDCFKRRHAQLDFGEINEPMDDSQESAVAAREIVEMLSAQLTGHERLILDALSDGASANEIARRLGIAHSTVSRARARIQNIAVRLGIEPPRKRVYA